MNRRGGWTRTAWGLLISGAMLVDAGAARAVIDWPEKPTADQPVAQTASAAQDRIMVQPGSNVIPPEPVDTGAVLKTRDSLNGVRKTILSGSVEAGRSSILDPLAQEEKKQMAHAISDMRAAYQALTDIRLPYDVPGVKIKDALESLKREFTTDGGPETLGELANLCVGSQRDLAGLGLPGKSYFETVGSIFRRQARMRRAITDTNPSAPNSGSGGGTGTDNGSRARSVGTSSAK